MLKVNSLIIPLSLVFLSSSALAVESFRQKIPIVSGTELIFPNGECTAGLVVTKKGLFNNVTAYQRAVRYVVTAGHCGSVNDDVKVGSYPVKSRNTVVGKMIWKSSFPDLGLVKIEPSRRNSTHCSAPSTGLTCNIITTYDPLASGKIIVSHTGVTVGIRGLGEPSRNEVFCTSGRTTGIKCTWGLVAPPPGWVHPAYPERDQVAQTIAANLEGGDSGGPVASFGSRGLVYGIIGSKEPDNYGDYPSYMRYTPIAEFFRQQPDYEVATQ